MSKVFILADFSGEKASKTTAELATAGARIGSVTAVVLAGAGKGAALAATVNQGPIANVLVVESDDFAQFGVAASADALANLIKENSPAAVLIASHAFGKEVAARVAVLTESGIITDAVDVAADATATQLVFGGSTTVHSKVSHGTPIITVRPNSVEADLTAATPAIENATAAISDAAKKSKISSSEWERILKGFNTALQQLSEYETEDELIKILKFEIMNSKNSLIVALENIDELEGFLSKMIDWISSMIVDEDYILIMKKK